MVGYRISYQTGVDKMMYVRWCCIIRMRNNGCWYDGLSDFLSNRNGQNVVRVMVLHHTHEDMVGQGRMSKVRYKR